MGPLSCGKQRFLAILLGWTWCLAFKIILFLPSSSDASALISDSSLGFATGLLVVSMCCCPGPRHARLCR